LGRVLAPALSKPDVLSWAPQIELKVKAD
jgi:hypothetical protein